MNRPAQLFGECGIHHPVAFQPGFAAKLFRSNHNAEMGFPFGPGSAMTVVAVALIHHFQPHGLKSFLKLCRDCLADCSKFHPAFLPFGCCRSPPETII